MARIEGGDLIALEAKCHLHCLTSLWNCYLLLIWKHEQKLGNSSEEKKLKTKAFVKFYANNENCVEDGTFASSFLSCINYMKSDCSILLLRKRLTEVY